jgi:hypothetical protein
MHKPLIPAPAPCDIPYQEVLKEVHLSTGERVVALVRVYESQIGKGPAPNRVQCRSTFHNPLEYMKVPAHLSD